MQYTFHALTANRQRAHMNRFIEDVKELAWKPTGGNPPLTGTKKYVTLPDQSEDGSGQTRRFAIDFGGNVYLVDPKSGEENLLDLGEIQGAHWKRTLVYSLPVSLWAFGVGLFEKKEKGVEIAEEPSVNEENGVASNPLGKHVKAEKVAGRRKARKRN
jgi:hypothetical protein